MPDDSIQKVVYNSNSGLKWLVYVLSFVAVILCVIVYILWHRTQEVKKVYTIERVNTADFLQRNAATAVGSLTVNGRADILGDLHVTGSITSDGNAISTNTASDYFSNYYTAGCNAQVICNSTLLQAAKEFVIQPSSPYVVGGTIRGAANQVVDLLQLQNSSGYSMVNVTANGQLGVNNPTPVTTLDVNGTAHFTGHTATGNVSAIDNPSILTPLTGTPIIRVNGTQEVVTSLTPGYNYYSGASSEYFVNLGESATSQFFTGGYHAGEIMSGNPQNYHGLAGETGLAVHEGTGDINIMAGVLGYAYNNSSGTIGAAAGTFGYLKNNDSGTIGVGYGAGGLLENSGAGTVVIANGLSASVTNGSIFAISGSGTINNANGVTSGITNNSSGNITNASVVDIQRVVNNGTGSITNVHGLYIADESGVGTGDSFNIYSRGTSSKNVFDGSASFGGDPKIFGTNSRLMINHSNAFGWETTDNTAIAQINVSGANTALVLQGAAFSSGKLQQWQSFNGTTQSVVDQNGSFGIGTSTITHRLTTTNTSTTNVAKFNGSGGTQCTVVTGTGWSCSSDETLKTNILNVANGLDIIKQIQGVTYNWKSDP
nr:tail fiber domain-containing protein [Candidatus Saccharibacteria bacterium]